MSYLYGDSTPSGLDINFIEFLRDAVEFCVQVLAADERIAEGKARTQALEKATTAEIAKLQRIGAVIPRALEGAPIGEADTAAARCVTAIVRAADELVRSATGEVTSALEAEIKKRDEAAARDREGCLKALEALLVRHDLPDMKSDLRVAVGNGGSGYTCRMQATTSFGLEVLANLEVPPNNLFERVVRVDRVMERIEIQVPEMGGWLHKEIRLRAQHLEKHHVAELLLKSGGSTLKLRVAADGKGPGFDVLFSGDVSPPRLVRVDDEEKGAESFDVEEADRGKLLAVRDKLASAAAELARHRKAVLEAKLDGEPLRTHPQPSLVVERLIATIAPVVQEISARSQSPGELVLRRSLGGDRREEIFLSKQDLKLKLEPLRDIHRALFDPLWRSAIAPRPAPPSDSPPVAVPVVAPLPAAVPAAVVMPPLPAAVVTPPVPSAVVTTPVPPSVVAPPPPPPPRHPTAPRAVGLMALAGELDVVLDDEPSAPGGPSKGN